jgi:predicted transcriptional regulator
MKAADELAEVGLLKEDKDSKKKGRRVQFYQKVTWDELTDDAKNEADRLQIPRSVFE